MSKSDVKGPSLSRNALLDLGRRFPADPESEAAARARVDRVVSLRLPQMNVVLASVFASLCHKVYSKTPGLETWALACGADRQPVLLIDPDFTNAIDHLEGVCFVAGHEPYHDILGHLRDPIMHNESSQRNLQLAEDAMINYLLIKLGFTMPTIDGKVVGVEPTNLYKWAKDKCKEHNLEFPENIAAFYRNEQVVFSILESIPNERRNGKDFCSHGKMKIVPGEGGSSSGEGSMPDMDLPRDETVMGQLVEQVLEIAVNDALNGNEAAKREINDLIDVTEGSEQAEKVWGSLGAYAVRGTTPTRRQSRDWYKWTMGFVARRLSRERCRDQYNRKVPFDPRISPKGRGRKKLGYVGIDTSGSMHDAWVQNFLDKLGKAHPNLEIVPVAWDAKAELLTLGGDVHGGGGTRFEAFDDFVWEHSRSVERQDPDFILTVTDGYFSKPSLRFDASLYGFLIMPGGDTFMKDGYLAADGTAVPKLRTHEIESID